jgi:hypothetical protein
MIESSGGRMPPERPSAPPTVGTSLPCPSWCQQECGHRFDSCTDGGMVIRLHTMNVGAHVDVVGDEAAITIDGPVWEMGEPRLFLDVEPGDELDGPAARKIARELLEGASILERLS